MIFTIPATWGQDAVDDICLILKIAYRPVGAPMPQHPDYMTSLLCAPEIHSQPPWGWKSTHLENGSTRFETEDDHEFIMDMLQLVANRYGVDSRHSIVVECPPDHMDGTGGLMFIAGGEADAYAMVDATLLDRFPKTISKLQELVEKGGLLDGDADEIIRDGICRTLEEAAC